MYYELLVDLKTGEVAECRHLELETLKEQITRETGHKPVGHRSDSFGCKLKSRSLLAKSFRHKILAQRRRWLLANIAVLVFVHLKKVPSIHEL